MSPSPRDFARLAVCVATVSHLVFSIEMDFLHDARAHVVRSLAENEAEESAEGTRDATFVIGILALGLTFVVGTLLERKHIHWVPEAAVGVLIGVLCAGAAAIFENDAMLSNEKLCGCD